MVRERCSYPTFYYGPQWPSYSSTTTVSCLERFGGPGGAGKPVSAFKGPNLLGMVPTPAFPLDFLLNTHGIWCPTGHYGGGGGGGS